MPSNSFSATERECTQYNFPPYFFRKDYRKILRRRNRNPQIKRINLASRNSTPLNSFSEKEGECAKYFLPLILGTQCSEMEGFCKLRKENDGKIIKRAGKFG